MYLADRRGLAESAGMEQPAPATTLSLACLLLLAGCATPARPPETERTPLPPPPVTDASFCRDAQRTLVSTTLAAENEVTTSLDAFAKSKPAVRPLTSRQYLWTEAGAPERPMMVSCKMKTADHLIAEYGVGAAGADIGCSGVNRLTLERLSASMTPAERQRLRFPPEQVVFDDDFVTVLGPLWLAPHEMARVGVDGRLRIQSRAMRNDWLDPRYAKAPPQFRGTRYCHFIAPEHLGRLLRGEVAPTPLP